MRYTAQNQLEHSLLSRASLHKMSLSSTGWNAGIIDPSMLGGPQVCLYIWDKATDWAWACSIPTSSFQELARNVDLTPAAINSVRGSISYSAQEVAHGRPPPEVAGASWEYLLGWLLANYAVTTQAYQTAGNMAEGGHFFVAHYQRSPAENGLLRPFACLAESVSLIPAEQAMDYFRQVHLGDLHRHPEWFHPK